MPVVAVDASGNVYVAESGNHRVQKFTSDGTFLAKWGTFGSGDDPCTTGTTITGVEPGIVYLKLQLTAKPNPFTGQATLRFSLPQEGRATLSIYDMQGRRLRHWNWVKLPAGPHQVAWDGKTDDGRGTSSGVLFYRLDANGRSVSQRMVHIR